MDPRFGVFLRIDRPQQRLPQHRLPQPLLIAAGGVLLTLCEGRRCRAQLAMVQISTQLAWVGFLRFEWRISYALEILQGRHYRRRGPPDSGVGALMTAGPRKRKNNSRAMEIVAWVERAIAFIVETPASARNPRSEPCAIAVQASRVTRV